MFFTEDLGENLLPGSFSCWPEVHVSSLAVGRAALRSSRPLFGPVRGLYLLAPAKVLQVLLMLEISFLSSSSVFKEM